VQVGAQLTYVFNLHTELEVSNDMIAVLSIQNVGRGREWRELRKGNDAYPQRDSPEKDRMPLLGGSRKRARSSHVFVIESSTFRSQLTVQARDLAASVDEHVKLRASDPTISEPHTLTSGASDCSISTQTIC